MSIFEEQIRRSYQSMLQYMSKKIWNFRLFSMGARFGGLTPYMKMRTQARLINEGRPTNLQHIPSFSDSVSQSFKNKKTIAMPCCIKGL